jgi:hypothetical protein
MSAADLGTLAQYSASAEEILLAASLRSRSRSRSGTNSEEGHLPPLTRSLFVASTTGNTISSLRTFKPLLQADAVQVITIIKIAVGQETIALSAPLISLAMSAAAAAASKTEGRQKRARAL